MSENNVLNGQYTVDEMKEMIRRMRAANSTFYGLAVSTGVHAFIEFCGLQAKYIDLCNALLDSGIEFPRVNVHNDRRVDVEYHHIDYLAEKFECIYGPIFAGNPERVRYFIERVFGKEYLRENDHVERTEPSVASSDPPPVARARRRAGVRGRVLRAHVDWKNSPTALRHVQRRSRERGSAHVRVRRAQRLTVPACVLM